MKEQLQIGIITASLSRKAGGLYDAVRSLCLALRGDVSVFGLEDKYTITDNKGWGKLKVKSFKIKGLKSFGLAPKLWQELKATPIDILHLHGLWMYPQFTSLKWKRSFKKSVVISPHGMLDAWAIQNASLKKKIVGTLFAYQSLQSADCIHALCYSEYEAIRAFGLKNPVAIIPNGIHLPKPGIKKIKVVVRKTLLFVGRIHPKKGLIILLEALNILNQDQSTFFQNWKLQIVGWDQDNHLQELITLVDKYNLNNHVEFTGPLYNNDKIEKLQTADAFILPSYSEGLPMSILEAWSYRLPVLITDQCNLPEGFEAQAAIKLDLNANHIAEQLIYLNNLNAEKLKEMANNGYNLVGSKFTWDRVAQQMEQTYSWVLGETSQPNFVMLD